MQYAVPEQVEIAHATLHGTKLDDATRNGDGSHYCGEMSEFDALPSRSYKHSI